MDARTKLQYIYQYGYTIIPESEMYGRITASQVRDVLLEYLPDDCTVQTQSISKWLSGERSPNRENRIALERLFVDVAKAANQ